MSFYEYKCGNREYLRSALFPKDKVSHAFTSASGGVSHGRISGLNLGFRVKDDSKSVRENYRLVAEDLGLSLDMTVLSKQTHTDNVRVVTREDGGKGITRESDIKDTDGLICNIPNMALVVFTADCIPILLYDEKARAVGAVHSGWRGTVKRIGEKAVGMMCREFGCEPRNIKAAIGPGIGSCCFEFGTDAPQYFEQKYLRKKDGKYFVDIWSMNRDILTESGVPLKNVDVCEVCTVCNSDKYYSYRTHRDKTGRQAAIIMLKQ